MSIQQYNPVHPGIFIKKVYLEPFNLGINMLAERLDVSPSAFSRLINAKSDVSPVMALRLSKVLGRSPESWLQMQDNYDLAQANKSINLRSLKQLELSV